MYKVIKHFVDLQDKNHPYYVGETYPRKGLGATKERLDELASNNNKRGEALIEEVKETQKKAETKKTSKK